MTWQTEIYDTSPKVSVQFTRSSQRDGQQGYSISVNEDADETEAKRVMALARELHDEAEKVIGKDEHDAV